MCHCEYLYSSFSCVRSRLQLQDSCNNNQGMLCFLFEGHLCIRWGQGKLPNTQRAQHCNGVLIVPWNERKWKTIFFCFEISMHLFQREICGEREIVHLLVHSLNVHNSQNWERLKPGVRNQEFHPHLPLEC